MSIAINPIEEICGFVGNTTPTDDNINESFQRLRDEKA